MKDFIQEKKKINAKLESLKKEVSKYEEDTEVFNERFDNMVLAYVLKHTKGHIDLADLHKHIPVEKLETMTVYSSSSSSPADFVDPKNIINPSVKNSVIHKKYKAEPGMYNAYFSVFNDGGNIIVFHRDVYFGDDSDIRKVTIYKEKNNLLEIGVSYIMVSNSTGKPVGGTHYFNFIVDKEKLNKFLNSNSQEFKAHKAPVAFPYM